MPHPSQSREALAVMESSPSLAYSDSIRKPGCFVSRKAGIGLSVFCLCAVMATVMLTYYFVPSYEATSAASVSQDVQKQQISNQHDLASATLRRSQAVVKAIDVRLPTAIKPVRYVLRLQPLINGNFTIVGSTEITLDVLEATSNVTLHIADIITKNETVKLNPIDDLTGPGIAISEHLYDHERNFYIANLAEDLVAGQQYVLSMDFEGYLNDQLAGFYRSQYTDEDGMVKWMAVTQFEPTDARRAFPCFDEPAMKAEFEVYLAREKSMSSISNMPRMETTDFPDDDQWVWDHFYNSVPMSTYLVAFVVSDFAHVNSTANDHVLFRIWARPGAIDQTEYARQAGPAILTWYEGYFNISFPLPKQDMIAIPDFSAGAMENWGLITYRETALLFDEELGSASNKERVANVVAHELAHQWFGDLVTMEWWTDLWLNEGFASYMESLGTDSFEPTFNYTLQFITDNVQYAFGIDSLESSHPISIPVNHPDEINQIFDAISYSKGASIIRMMNHFLTEETFRAGITKYLNRHAYGNAAQDDLWQALTEQAEEDGTLPAGLTVKTIMDTWTLQMGYPVINVVLNGDGTATLTQKRFLLVPNPNSNDTNVYRWWLPISFTSEDNPDFGQTQATEWMEDVEETKIITGLPAAGNWVMLNLQQTGYYRVNYEDSNWQSIVTQLRSDFTVIDTHNRAQALDDALDLARAGELSYDVALDVNSYLSNETEYVPWTAALNNLGYLESMFTRTSGYGAMKEYLLALITPLYNSVGFADDTSDAHMDQKKRVKAVSWACHLGLEDCVQNSVTLFSAWMADPTDTSIISPNLRSTVYCTGIAEGGVEEWDFLWGEYLKSNVASEQSTILRQLGCSKEIFLLERYLEIGFTEGSGVRKQDSYMVFGSVSDNDIGRDVAWDYLRNNFDAIAEYHQSFSAIGGLVEDVTYEFNTELQLQELIQFEVDHKEDLSTATQSIEQSKERTVNNIAWMENYYNVILDWLQDNGYGTPLLYHNIKKHI